MFISFFLLEPRKEGRETHKGYKGGLKIESREFVRLLPICLSPAWISGLEAIFRRKSFARKEMQEPNWPTMAWTEAESEPRKKMLMTEMLRKNVFHNDLVASGLPEPAAPCAACFCPLYWRDCYGGLHCFSCQPPPAAGMAICRPLVIDVKGVAKWTTLEVEIDGLPRGLTHSRQKVLQAAVDPLPLLMMLAEKISCPENFSEEDEKNVGSVKEGKTVDSDW